MGIPITGSSVYSKKLANEGTKIEVIDFKQNSGAEGLLVMKAEELIHNGSNFEGFDEYKKRTNVFLPWFPKNAK